MTNHTAGTRRRLLSHLRSLDRRLWLAWLAATTLGWAAGLFGYRVLADVFYFAGWLKTLDGIGFCIALLQALVLRRHLDHAAWWLVVSGSGGVVAVYLRALVNVTVLTTTGNQVAFVATDALTALGTGILVGALQWLVVRRQLARAQWWIPVSGLGVLVGAFTGDVVGVVVVIFVLNVEVDQNAFVIASGLVSATIYGAITGYALVRLLRHRSVPTATPPPPASAPPRA